MEKPVFKVGTMPYLFVKLSQPDENGVSRWVSKSEFVDEYAPLMFQNGASWCRAESTIARYYYVEFDKSVTPGNGVDRIRLNGYKKEEKRLKAIEKELSKSSTIHRFDDEVFKKLISKVIMGDYEEDGSYNPNVVKFVLNLKNISSEGNTKFLSLEVDERCYES